MDFKGTERLTMTLSFEGEPLASCETTPGGCCKKMAGSTQMVKSNGCAVRKFSLCLVFVGAIGSP